MSSHFINFSFTKKKQVHQWLGMNVSKSVFLWFFLPPNEESDVVGFL